MKKIFAMALALCLMCGTTALADTTITQDTEAKSASTTLSYTIEECTDYTVTIPSKALLVNRDGTLNGSIAVKLNTSTFNVANKKITVKLEQAGLKLVNGTNEIIYTLMAGGEEYKSGDTIIEWTYGEKTDQSNTLILQAYPSSNLPAGEYTDTLTFSVSVEDTSAGE